jgi:hypothetical protein
MPLRKPLLFLLLLVSTLSSGVNNFKCTYKEEEEQ